MSIDTTMSGTKTRLPRRALVAFAVIGCFLSPTAVMAGDWQKLGSRLVAVVGDHGVSPVTVQKSNFRKIKLKERDNEINDDDLIVIYGTGASDRTPNQRVY